MKFNSEIEDTSYKMSQPHPIRPPKVNDGSRSFFVSAGYFVIEEKLSYRMSLNYYLTIRVILMAAIRQSY